MKEFIIKDDEIHYSKKEKLNDFQFVTNDDKDKVKTISEPRMFGSHMYHDYSYIDKRTKREIVNSDMKSFDVTHKNYMTYLDNGYSGDWGIIIRADFIWFTILNEIASIVKKDPETFRKYFSDEQEKQNIQVHTLKYANVPVNEFVEEVLKKIPSNLTEEMIVPKFTTLDEKSGFAFKCAFLDTTSPFYTYQQLYCGYNKIKILGEKSDYELIGKSFEKISEIIPELKDYYKKCQKVVDEILLNWDDVEFWKNICKTKRGYGKQEIDGWFVQFFSKSREKYNSVEDFSEQIVKLNYKSPDGDYTMYVGILSSKLEDGYMVPDFNRITTKNI